MRNGEQAETPRLYRQHLYAHFRFRGKGFTYIQEREHRNFREQHSLNYERNVRVKRSLGIKKKKT